MIKLEIIEFIRIFIAGLIGYIPIITFGGFLSALISKRLGDRTAHDEGYLTLNPMVHVDLIGLILLMIPPYIGFIRGIPLDPENIRDPYKKIKILLLFFVNSISNFLGLVISLLFASFFLSILVKGFHISPMSLPPFAMAVLLIFRAMIGISGFSMIINFLSAGIKSIIYFYFPEHRDNPAHLYVLFLIPLVLLLLFSNVFDNIFNVVVLSISKFLNYLI